MFYLHKHLRSALRNLYKNLLTEKAILVKDSYVVIEKNPNKMLLSTQQTINSLLAA